MRQAWWITIAVLALAICASIIGYAATHQTRPTCPAERTCYR